MIAAIVIIAVVLIAASHHHGRHFERNRRSGLTISESMRGPLGSRIRVSKRF